MVTAGSPTAQVSRRFTHAHDLRGGARGDRALQRRFLSRILADAYLIGGEFQISVKGKFRIAHRPDLLAQPEFGSSIGDIAQPALSMQRRRLIDVIRRRIPGRVLASWRL